MPRSHGRISTGIWSDAEFTALREAEQRAYMLAMSQPSISYAGVVPYTLRRWQGLASDSTIARLRKSFLSLQRQRYVLIDEATEEMLLRTFIKHDGVLTNPNVVKASIAAYKGILSPVIKGAFLVELHRLHEGPQEEAWAKGWAAGFDKVLMHPLPYGFPDPLLNPFPEWSEYARAAPCISPNHVLTATCSHGVDDPARCPLCRHAENGAGSALARTGARP